MRTQLAWHRTAKRCAAGEPSPQTDFFDTHAWNESPIGVTCRDAPGRLSSTLRGLSSLASTSVLTPTGCPATPAQPSCRLLHPAPQGRSPCPASWTEPCREAPWMPQASPSSSRPWCELAPARATRRTLGTWSCVLRWADPSHRPQRSDMLLWHSHRLIVLALGPSVSRETRLSSGLPRISYNPDSQSPRSDAPFDLKHPPAEPLGRNTTEAGVSKGLYGRHSSLDVCHAGTCPAKEMRALRAPLAIQPTICWPCVSGWSPPPCQRSTCRGPKPTLLP